MTTFLEIAAHSVDHMLSICKFYYSRFGFEGWIWVLIAPVPDLCILFTIAKAVMIHREYYTSGHFI